MSLTAVALPSDRVPATTEAARLFEAHSERLLGYCLGQLGSRPEAEDAVQTTFVYALRALRRGVVPENEAAWLTTIAKNVCHWQRRTLARRGPLSTDLDLDAIALARPEGDEEGLLFGLEDALASIPEKQREAILLREWRGLAPREIATELGISGPATHALLTRARHSLAQALTLLGRPAAGVAWLVFELRSYLKALLSGASAKAAVAGVALVGVGAGGVVAERTLADPAPPAGPSTVLSSPETQTRATGVAPQSARADVTAAVPGEREKQVGSTGEGKPTTTRDRSQTTRAVVPIAPPLPNGPTDQQPQAPAGPDAPVDLPVEPPALPKAELPSVDAPPVDLPPVDLPPLDLGTLPPVDLPPVDVPPVDLPPLLP